MAKSSRSSVTKTNRKQLKSRVFGPAEDARTERLSRKLLELASQPKAPQVDADVEPVDDATKSDLSAKVVEAADDTTMDVDKTQKPQSLSRNAEKKRKEEKRAGIAKKRHRKATNSLTFPKRRVPAARKSSKR